MKCKLVNNHSFVPNAAALKYPTRRLLSLLVTLVVITLSAIGCACNSNNINQDDLYFPVHKEPQTLVLDASLPGILVADNGCLRVADFLIIWPYGYSLKTEDNEVWIINDKDQAVAKIGDNVRVRGGEIPASFAEEKVGQPLSESCEGPYWSAGGIMVE